MSKELYRKKIADKKQDIISLRTRIDKLQEDKKKRMDYFARNIKSTTSASTRENYRKNKVRESEKYTRDIENVKKKIESIKKEIEKYKKMVATSK
ncbi:hypothetical protein [Capnocytophaga canimorsus]|uniref:Uncharacterized protein n=2 Tax=Capnocytophaga canimorsus TaxID=28188 RepID=F9YW13_CAPCC|nr:hypothetical protein [Capnocytophaga canimorsus]AEK24516.1 Hypothetical protein Ccan_24020 [Capnocytophaga canimorsus Cc5]ATA77366.1 hypothetical protein CGC47_07110 [Capnocytophaga canimorsus]AWL78833.1 hypothetical protein DKB58_07705 [Capnocytophaga canimorsus]AYW37438.1 hypothetical protein D8L92_09140 [Capnocytophaga canimorsus]MDT9500223.1 hypothetical protein [Capnocytophaga canimorsus]